MSQYLTDDYKKKVASAIDSLDDEKLERFYESCSKREEWEDTEQARVCGEYVLEQMQKTMEGRKRLAEDESAQAESMAALTEQGQW